MRNGAIAGALLCLSPALALAAGLPTSGLLNSASEYLDEIPFEPFQLATGPDSGGLAFDLGGSETRKLQLELSEPLFMGVTTESRWLNFGGTELAAGSSLNWLINDDFSLGTGYRHEQVRPAFQTLGSIHCEDGVLAADSYRASGCYFVNDANDLQTGTLSFGANYRLNDNATAAFNLFRQDSNVRNQGLGGLGSPVLDAGLLTPAFSNPQLQVTPGQPLDYLDSEMTGIDLELAVGVSTGRAGDLRLGLQLTRVLDGEYEGFSTGAGLQDWKVVEPFDSARMSVDWAKGAFSGGIQSFYREPVEFLNRDSLDSITTFDVHFTWRTPWNASLSVGATNLLNSGAEEQTEGEKALADPFESIYGRIPYVRYKQDL